VANLVLLLLYHQQHEIGRKFYNTRLKDSKMSQMQIEVVSATATIYSGSASFDVAPGISGELGIYPGHTPLLTRIQAGVLRIQVPEKSEEVLVAVSGGVIEIQPHCITVLADMALRSEELDAEKAHQAKLAAENALKSASGERSVANAEVALASAIAQLKMLDYVKLRKH
jgi:F-type H+-transporting ATPase subunit epsilon